MTTSTEAAACPTCGDSAEPMRLLRIDAGGDAQAAPLDGEGGGRRVDVSLVDGVMPGDVVLVHAGVAIALAPVEGAP